MSHKSRLLLLTPDFPPNRGGVARYLSRFAEHFSDQILVIAAPMNESSLFDVAQPYPIERVSLLFRHLWPRWLKVVALLIKKQDDYDHLVISHAIPFGVAAAIAQFFTKKPYTLIVHGMDIRLAINHPRKRKLLGFALKNAHRVVANSQALSKELEQLFSLTNVVVVYPGIIPINNVPRSTSDDVFRLLTVSRLVQRKGQDRVLKALSLLKSTHRLGKIHYDIVGSGPTRSKLEELIAQLHLEQKVTLHGDLNDTMLSNMYAQSDVFVMPVKDDPIDKEGFGFVFLEAALYRVPSISTKMSGIDEAVVDQQTGILIEDGNIEALASAIESMVNHPEKRKQLGQAAYERTVTEFTCQKQFAKLESAFLYE